MAKDRLVAIGLHRRLGGDRVLDGWNVKGMVIVGVI